MKFEKKYLWTLVASASLTLAACGGGGGSDSGSGDDNNNGGGGSTPNRVSLTGLAVKGVMYNADITVTSLNGATTYGTTRTAEDGTYSLADMDLPLNVALLVTMTTNSDTMLTCDAAAGCTDASNVAHDFGESYAFNDANFSMTAVIAPMTAENASLTLMVTPVTHMAAERVIQSGATTAADITAVNTATANLLGLNGVDIATAIPADITKSESSSADTNSQKYGALVAGFASAANSTGKTITEVVSSVATEYAERGGLVANASDDSDVDLEDLFGGAASSAAAASLTATETLFLQEEAVAAAEEEDQWVEANEDEVPVASTQAEAVTNAVALLESLNGWSETMDAAGDDLTAFANENAQQLDTLLPAFDDQSQVLRGVRELLVRDETYPLCEYDWNTDTEVCNGSVTMQAPGLLFNATDVLTGIITMAGYANAHTEVWQETATAGEYQVSAADLMEAGVALDDLYDFLTDSDTGEITGDVVLTIISDGEMGIQISVSGYNDEGVTIESGTLTRNNTINTDQTDAGGMGYSIESLVMEDGTTGERFESNGEALFQFTSIAARDEFMAARTDGAVEVSLASMTSVTFELTSTVTGVASDSDTGVVQQTATLESTIELTRGDDGYVTAAADVGLSVKPTDGSSDEVVSGTLSFAATGTHSESGDSSFYIQSFDAEAVNLTFNGDLMVENTDGATASFSGVVVFAADNEENVAGLVLDGTVVVASDYIQDDNTAVPGELSFTGNITLGAEPVTAAMAISVDDTSFLLETAPYALNTMVVNGQLVQTFYGTVEALNLDLTAAMVRDFSDGTTALVASLDAAAYGYEDGNITIAMTETADEEISGGLVFSYGSQAITLSLDSMAGLGDAAGNNLLVTDGVTSMQITASCAPDTVDAELGTCADTDVQYGGNIYSAGFEVGKVEVRDGLPVFVFNDGSSYNLVVTPSFLISANQ